MSHSTLSLSGSPQNLSETRSNKGKTSFFAFRQSDFTFTEQQKLPFVSENIKVLSQYEVHFCSLHFCSKSVISLRFFSEASALKNSICILKLASVSKLGDEIRR